MKLIAILAVVLVLLVIVAIGLIIILKKKGYLGKRSMN
jgi:hypothetical protein